MLIVKVLSDCLASSYSISIYILVIGYVKTLVSVLGRKERKKGVPERKKMKN